MLISYIDIWIIHVILMVKLILVNTNDIKRYNMYKVKKKVHSEAKPDWMVGVLYQIPPKVYDWQESYDACMKHLIIIKDILEKSSVKWHRGSRNLTQIRNVKVKGESLLVLTKAGRSTLSFRIIQK